jgi:hypothetical protein
MKTSTLESKEKAMRFRRKFFFKALLVVAMIAVLGLVVMRLWNWVVPGLIVDAHEIDYARAIGLLVLCRILFGGFRGGGGCRARQWQRWQHMTPEEREQLRSGTGRASRESPERGA